MKATASSANSQVEEAIAMTSATRLFHSVSDPSRLVILQHLLRGEYRVVDRIEHGTISEHSFQASGISERDWARQLATGGLGISVLLTQSVL